MPLNFSYDSLKKTVIDHFIPCDLKVYTNVRATDLFEREETYFFNFNCDESCLDIFIKKSTEGVNIVIDLF